MIDDPSRGRGNKNTFRIGVISSIPGIGKTRLLLELYNLLPGIDAIYYVTFSDLSDLLNDFDNIKDAQYKITQSAKKSAYPIELICPRGLDYRQQSAILENFPLMSGWRVSKGTKQILSGMGSLPRLLEAFIRIILQKLEASGSFDDLELEDLESSFKWDGQVQRYV